ncbi:unnamed protein product [Oikopleura dioica]|uniref:Cubilin n=1 Tax=Oikopleura dioica TaxID=34765 RepID=E4Y9I7_OIKDI|nr:unnamed protein product [Oikopleura dioica]
MNIEGGQCTWDFMSITFDDGTGTGVICGNNIPPPGVFSGPGPCVVQFTSDNGVTLPGFQLEYVITPDDLCIGNLCENDSECIQDDSDPRGYTCNCPAGITGDFCQSDIDECDEGFCENGICENFFPGFTCECAPFFTGDSCNLELDACFTRNAPCNLTGTDFCESLDPFLFQPPFLCNCKAGYFPDDCGISVCDTENPCRNGNCFVSSQGDARCRCNSNETGSWIGQSCDVFEVSTNPGMKTFLTTLIIAAGSIALYFILSYCYKRGQVILKHHSGDDQPDTVNQHHDQFHSGPRDRSLPRVHVFKQ